MTRFASLEAFVLEPSSRPEQSVVLLHGYGAPGSDLVGLAPQIAPDKATRFIFFQAPHLLPGMQGPFAGRAWWDIDMMQLQVAIMTQDYDALAHSHPPGLDEATTRLDEALVELEARSGQKWGELYVGGFSQGAMLSCHWALTRGRDIAGLIQLSGTVLCQEQWQEALAKRPPLSVFQSHSPQDQVLPFALAERLRAMFEKSGSQHRWVRFLGGHGIGPEVVEELRRFLS